MGAVLPSPAAIDQTALIDRDGDATKPQRFSKIGD
jgi:hypothetical protein